MSNWEVRHGDCRDVMRSLPPESVDAIVSDPPYGLSFMGKEWDHGVPGVEFWTEALRVAKPGAHLVAFGGTRTYHRLAVAIEDAGWEVRDCLSYLYGSGFPKSHNLDKSGVFCGCEQTTERDVRLVQHADVSSPVQSQPPAGEVLLASVSQQGAPKNRAKASFEALRGGESSVEGRGHTQATEGELLGSPVRPCAEMGVADGEEGRLHRGASAGDGFVCATDAGPFGSGASPESRSVRQQAGELGTLADQRLAQESGVWPTCERCGKSRITRGLGTALKPAWEPIILARKPLTGTVAANVTQYGTGAINVDGCRIGKTVETWPKTRAIPLDSRDVHHDYTGSETRRVETGNVPPGRWPANVCLDEDAAALLDAQSGERKGMSGGGKHRANYAGGMFGIIDSEHLARKDTGGASRFFYTAKVSRREREAGLDGMPNAHPTLKPIALMRWLCRLVTPPGGLILDPFNGSGSTGCAAVLEGFRYLGAELEAEYVEIARRRIAYWEAQRAEPDLFG